MMINCVVYADGKRQADIAIDELPHVLANSEGFAWKWFLKRQQKARALHRRDPGPSSPAGAANG